MIDVKIIKKPRNEGAPSARQTAGTAYGSRTVKEAAHAARADMAELAKVAEKAREADRAHDLTPDSPAYNRFLRKDADDKAAGVVDFLKGLRLAGKALTGILTTGDTAGASEANVLSALRTLATFIRKDRPDTMPHLLKLLDGLETGTFVAGRTGGRIDKQGNGELGSLTLRDLLTAVRVITNDVRSKNYTPGDMGTGFGLTTGEGGSRLEVDYLLVRRVATFLELLIREMRHVGGTLVLSGASGKVVRVEDKPSAWRVYFKTREDGTTVAHGFTVGAQARCQTYNRTSGNTYYWRLVTAVGDDWVELSKSDYDHAAPTGTARTAPAVGDELVQLGHRTDSRQTGAIVLDTVGEGAPSIRLLKDIRSYSITDANVRVLLSPSAVRVIADEVSFASSGKTVKETITESERAVKNYFNEQKKEIDSSIGEVSGKVDNLVIGGRNLLVSTQFTKRDSYQTVRGTYRIELDSVERYQGSNSLKLTNTKAGKIYEDVLVSGEQPAAGEDITVSLYAKAAAAGTRLSVRVCDNGEVQQTIALTTAWQRISFTFHGLKTPSRAIGIWFDRAGTVWVALPKMEVGNKVTDWSPAPEDVASDAVAKANQALQDAKSYVNDIQQKLSDSLNTARTELKQHAADLDTALLSNAQTYADGKVTESEKRMVEDNRKKLQSEQEAATKRLNEAIAGALTTAKGYVKDVQVGGRNYFGFHKEVRVSHHGTLSPDNNGVVFRNGDVLNCRIQNLNLPGAGWYAVSMFIRATKACTIASINLCDAVSKDRTLEKVSVTTSFRYITGVFHAERFINDNVWNGFLDFESSIDPSIEVTVRDLMITPGNQPMSWVPAPEDLYADIAAKAKAAQDAAKKYTEEQDRYYQTLHNAYADDQVTASEKRMIKDAEEKLQEAKRDAQAKADVALNTANQHTNAIKDTLNSAIGAAQTAAQNVQKNLDNLTIGGRNLLRYSALDCPHITDALQLRGGHTAIIDKSQSYRGAPSAKIVALPGQSGSVDFGWRTWIEVQNGHKVAPLVMTFAAKSSVAGVSMCCRLGWIGEVLSVIQLTTEWKEYTLRLNPTRDWIDFIAWMNQACTVWISRPKLEYGTKPTDWTPAPEDVDNSITGVRNTANQASNDAGDAKRKAGEAAQSASAAAGSAKNAETKAGEAAGSAKNAATSAGTAATKANEAASSASDAKAQATNAATSANAAKADASKAKADAEAAAQSAKDSKAAADAAKTRLDSWAADNVISPMEKQGLRDETARIDADKSQVAAGYAKYGLGSFQAFTDAYNAYRAVLVALSSTKPETIAIPADFATKQRNYYTQRSTALTRIADAAKEYVDGLQIGGRNLALNTSDEWYTILNGATTNTTTYFRDAPMPPIRAGEFLSVSIEATWSDLKFSNGGRAVFQAVGDVSGWSKEALFDDRFGLPMKERTTGHFRFATSYRWTEERVRNNKFTFSIRIDKASGVLKIRRLMVVRGQKPMDWQPAPEDWVTKINDAKKAGTAAADALTAYKETVNGTFHDGIIEEAEARAIEKYRNIVNSEFGALTNTYNAINGNAYLEGTAKSALANAFNALRAAKDALITAVNNAISDKRVTDGEKQAVDAKYNAYQSAYAAYSAALEVANGSIHAKLKSLADKAANDIQVGGRNLIPDSDSGLLKRFIIHRPNNAPRYLMVDGWWRMAFDRDKQIVSRELTMGSVGTVQGLRKGNLAFSILCRTDGRIVPDSLKISFFGGGQHRYVPANIENCGNNTYRIWGVYLNYPVSDLRVPDFMYFSTADATYVEFRYPKLEYGTKPTDWTPAPEDITSEIAAKTEAARQAAQAEAIGLNKWIAQAFATPGENNGATPPKLEDIAGKTPTRTVELKDAQFNVAAGSGSVFGMDYYTGIRTTYVYLDADYNLTTGIQHDDAGSLYVNGTLVASGGIQSASWKSVTLPLKRGWNRIDGLWNEGGGGDYFKFQAPLENDAHIIQLACRPNVNIDPMRAVTMQSVEEQKVGFNTFNEQFNAWSENTEKTLTQYNDKLTKLTEDVRKAELKLDPKQIWLGITREVTNTVDDNNPVIVSELKSKTGIDIQQGVITLDAQKVKIQNGEQTMAMFEDGKLLADLIDASRIDASKLNAVDIFSQNITVKNNATITNLKAKDAVVEGKLEAASGSTIGGMTGYSSFLGFEAQRGTTSERILRIGTQAVPLSTGQHGMLYLTDKQRDAFKTIVYIESLGKEEKRWNLADARAHNKAIHIASGTLRVDPGNLVDMPGVLLSGRVSETGYVEYEYGRRRMGMGLAAFSVQLHDGRDWVGYTVTHNLGHTNYTVQATPYTPGWTWRKYMVHVDQLTANYFTLLCIDTGTDNRQVKGSFMFTVIGENTAN